jgi:hypothetical protein
VSTMMNERICRLLFGCHVAPRFAVNKRHGEMVLC